MKLFLILIFTYLLINNSYSQQEFKIDNFSDKYYGVIYISDTSNNISEGWIAIYKKSTSKKIIFVKFYELAFDFNYDKLATNIIKLPYEVQSYILYEDYNFDGINDFAIQDGQNGCQNTPSYQIFLAENNSFILNMDFTKLSYGNCGMFTVNYENKTIHTTLKSGCCWHQTTEYIIENNKPFAIIINEKSSDSVFNIHTEKVWNGIEMIETTTRTFRTDYEGITPLLMFSLAESNNIIALYIVADKSLNYVFLDPDFNVEAYYPKEVISENYDFIFYTIPGQNTLVFENEGVTYKIYESKNEEIYGISYLLNGEIYDLKGAINKKVGNLKNLKNLKLNNLIIK